LVEPQFREEPLAGPVALDLITALNTELRSRYPNPLDTHWDLSEEEVAPAQGRFVVAYLEELPVGCGAVRRIEPSVGELKRMYVVPAYRSTGIGRALVGQLEAIAVLIGIDRVVLETGVHSPDAIAMYRGAGYAEIPKFGQYVDSPLSYCMAKELRL
jgi:putative acetyltransferase